jgi:hypothetical protein
MDIEGVRLDAEVVKLLKLRSLSRRTPFVRSLAGGKGLRASSLDTDTHIPHTQLPFLAEVMIPKRMKLREPLQRSAVSLVLYFATVTQGHIRKP